MSTRTIYSKSSIPSSSDILVEHNPPLEETDLLPRIPNYLEKHVIPFIKDFLRGGAVVHIALKYLTT